MFDFLQLFFYNTNMKTSTLEKIKQPSNMLFIHRIFNGIANAVFGIFVPLLIYTATDNLALAFLFTAIKCFADAVLFLVGKKIIRKYAIMSLIFSIIPIIAVYFLVKFLLGPDITIWFILLIAFLTALHETLYYGAINLIFSVMDKNADSAKFDIGSNIGQILFTLLGAFALGAVKSSWIFVVIFATIMHIASVVPLIIHYKQLNLIVKNIPKNNQIKVIKDNKYFNLYHFVFGIVNIFMDVALQLYLAYNGLTFEAVGVFMAASQIVKIIASALAKFLQSKKKDKLAVIVCSALVLLSIVGILIWQQAVVIYIFTLIIAFACQLIHTVMFVRFVKSGVKTGYIYDTLYHRDFFQNTGRGITMIVYVLSAMFPIMFGLGIGTSILTGVFGTLAINDDDKKIQKISENDKVENSATKVQTE